MFTKCYIKYIYFFQIIVKKIRMATTNNDGQQIRRMSKRTQNKVNKEANQNLKMNWVKMEEQRKRKARLMEGPENEGQ